MTYTHQGLVPDDAPTGPIRIADHHASPPQAAHLARRGARWLWLAAGVAVLLLVVGVTVATLGGATPSVAGLGLVGPSDPCGASQTTLSGFGAPMKRFSNVASGLPGRTCLYVDDPGLPQYAVTVQDWPRTVADDPHSGVFTKQADPTFAGQTVNGTELRESSNGVLISVSASSASTVYQTEGHVWGFNATSTVSGVDFKEAGDGIAALVSSVGCEPYTRR